MNNQHLAFAALLAVGALWGCATPDGVLQVTQSPAPATPMGARYAWVPANESPRASDPRVDNRVVDLRVRTAFDSALASKGYSVTPDPAGAALQASYRISIQDPASTDVLSGHMFCGFDGCIGGYGPIADRTAEMTLELLDVTTGKLAWRATSKKVVTRRDADQDQLDHVTRAMTASLPPAR